MYCMNKLKRIIPMFLLIGVLLSACSGSSDDGNSKEVLTQAALIAIEGLTQTAAAAPPTATNTPEPPPTNTALPTATFTNTPESGPPNATNTQQSAQAGSEKPCWRGNLEYENVADGTIFYQNKVFTKTWRIKNTGTCTWPADTAAIWVKDELLGASSVVTSTSVEIAPNEYLEVNVDFLSPSELGTHKSSWMLRGGGAIFGVGHTGLSVFWVEIITIVDPN
jgi:hypothetical protein